MTSPFFYAVPGDTNSGSDSCLCNTVVYSLLSACSACKGSTFPMCVDQLWFAPRFQSINLLPVYVLVTLRIHPITPPWRKAECKSQVDSSTGSYARTQAPTPASPRPSQMAPEYPTGPTSTYLWVPSLSPSLAFPRNGIDRTFTGYEHLGRIDGARQRRCNRWPLFSVRVHIFTCLVDSPEITGTYSVVPTSTNQVSQSSITPSASGGSSSTSTSTSSPLITSTSQSSSSSTSTSQSSSNAGVMAGGIIGGIVGGVLITGFVVWFVFRRRRTRSPPSDLSDTSDPWREMGQFVSVPNPLTIETPTLYLSDSLFPSPQQGYHL